jgi:hypothetical protein
MSATPGDTTRDDLGDLETELRAMRRRRAAEVREGELDPDSVFVGDTVVQLIPLEPDGPRRAVRQTGPFVAAAVVLVVAAAGWAALGGGLDRVDLEDRSNPPVGIAEPPVMAGDGVAIPVPPVGTAWPPPELLAEIEALGADDRPIAPEAIGDLDDLATWLPRGFDAATATAVSTIDESEPRAAAEAYLDRLGVVVSGADGDNGDVELGEPVALGDLTVVPWSNGADDTGVGWILLRADDTDTEVVASLNEAVELSPVVLGPRDVTGYYLTWSQRDGSSEQNAVSGGSSSGSGWSSGGGGSGVGLIEHPMAEFLPESGMGATDLRVDLDGAPEVVPVEIVLEPQPSSDTAGDGS